MDIIFYIGIIICGAFIAIFAVAFLFIMGLFLYAAWRGWLTDDTTPYEILTRIIDERN